MPKFAARRTSFWRVFPACFFVCILLQIAALSAYAQETTTENGISLDSNQNEGIKTFAAELTDFASITIEAKDGIKYNEMQLADGRYTTKLNISGNVEIKIEARKKIDGLYIIWDKPPAYWALQAEEATRTSLYLHGKNGYIHEYIDLKEPSETISIITSSLGAEICEIQVFSEGVVPDEIQVWSPPYEDADMLLLSTHADDEHLFFGGTMPYYAGELKYKVQIAYLTNHWGEPYRSHELLNGLWAVGMTAYPVISEFVDYYSDNLEHAKSLYNVEDVFAYEVGLLRRFKPEVVIGHDVNGEYGHGVHMLNTWILQQAIHLASDETYLPQQAAAYGVFNVSKVYLHLYPENSVLMDWTIPLERFGGKTAFQMAEIGFSEHLSQQKWFSVRTTGVHDCRAFGLYYTAVGYDSGDGVPDFFENVEVFSDDPIQDPTGSSDDTTETGEDESVTNEKSETGYFQYRGLKPAILISGILLVLLIGFIVWGRKRDKR